MSADTGNIPTIADLAQTARLLVVSDFDGTIAGFSPDPYKVPVNQKSLKAIKRLSTQSQTNVAILSGRHLAGLAQVLDLGDYRITIVGSHGAEDSARPLQLSADEEAELSQIHAKLEKIISDIDGAFVEVKPFHRVLHFIRVSDPATLELINSKAALIDPGNLKVTHGKNIIEYSASTATKGSWLAAKIERSQPSGIVFIGDDTTDEDGFKELRNVPGALTIKVGAGDSAAKTRVADTEAVGDFLEKLAYHRMQHTEVANLGL